MWAQAENGPGDLWQTFTVKDGLGSGIVAAVFPAQDGAIWFGTEEGASRYNGRWNSLSKIAGLPLGRVRTITQTKDGMLWLGTRSGGLVRCAATGSDCARVTMPQGLPADDVRALLPDGSGGAGLWVGTARGLAYLDGQHAVSEAALSGVEIWALARGADGALLAGTASRGVMRRDTSGAWQSLAGASPLTGAAFALWVEESGRIWAGSDHGLFYYENSVWRRFLLIDGDDNLSVFAVAQDPDGGLWAATDQGLFHAEDTRIPNVIPAWLRASSGGLAHDYVRAMAFDSDGGLWLGTLAGVNRYAGNIWQAITAEELQGQRINAILTDSDGQTWVGTEYAGLFLWNGKRWEQFTADDGLSDNRVVTLFQDSKGRVWVSMGAGLGYRTAAGKWQLYAPSGGRPDLPVYSITQEASGTLLFAGQGGVSRLDESDKFQPLTALTGKRVNAVYRGRDGALWFGADRDGLLKMVGGQLQSVKTPSGVAFGNVVVNGIVTSPDGTLWVGTYDAGLWRLIGDKWERVEAPLATPSLLSLRYLDNGLWVGTRQGFGRFDGKTWQSYVGDGLPASEVLVIASGPGGSIWIGTTGGLVRYQPDKTPPWVKVESVNLIPVVNGVATLTTDLLKEIRLFGGDLATRSTQLVYQTQLEGVDTAPQMSTSDQVTFSDRRLAAGTYHLRAWARDSSLNYSQPVDVTISVPKVVGLPGGRTIQADVFYSIVLLGLLAIGGMAAAGGVSWRTRHQERARKVTMLGHQRQALERHFNPYISGEPVRQIEMFFGRDDLLRKILNALHQNSIMIHGERRMGKTTLLYQLAQALRAADDPVWVFIPVSTDLEGTPQERFFYLLMEAIWGVLQAYLTETPPTLHVTGASPAAYTDREFAADLREILERVKQVVAPRNVRVVLMIDEMDVIDSYDRMTQLQLRRIFMSPLAENLGAVVAGIQISKAWDRVESPWFNLFIEFPLEPFNDAQARILLTEPVRGVYEWDPAALDFVLAHADGRPYRLQQYALEAINRMLAAKRLRVMLEDVEAADDLLERTRSD